MREFTQGGKRTFQYGVLNLYTVIAVYYGYLNNSQLSKLGTGTKLT